MLEWNVYCENFNAQKIEIFNVFRHYGFHEDCKKAARKYSKDKEAFEKAIKSSAMYYFWSKCEWEIILSDWPPSGRFSKEKIDVYDQLRLNWQAFIDYTWDHAVELRRREKKEQVK